MDPVTDTNISRPIAVTRAVQLFSASFIIGAIRAMFDLAHKLSGVGLLLGLIGWLIFFGFAFFLVSKLAAGRNWCRILFLILLIIGLPFAVPLYIAELRVSVLGGSLSILAAVLQAVAIILLFTGNSGSWFRRRT